MEPTTSAPSHTRPDYEAKEKIANDELHFASLCNILEQVVSRSTKASERLGLIFSASLRKTLKGGSPFPLVRLLLPKADTTRGRFNLKQATIARMYVSLLGLNPVRAVDARRLIHFRDPTLGVAQRVSFDMPEVLETVLQGRVRSTPSTLTLRDVNRLLDALARADTTEERKEVLQKILNSMSAREQKWLMRIVLHDLRIGLKQDQARDMFDVSLNLREVCATLCDGKAVVSDNEAAKVTVFRPFTPMLAARFAHQLTMVEPAMKGHPFAVERKVDGERLLCHKDGDKVVWLTRSATDYTSNYGSVLTPAVLEGVKATSCILDGEVVGFDPEYEVYLPFKENRSVAAEEANAQVSNSAVANATEEAAGRRLVYCVFDIVYLRGPGTEALLRSHGVKEVPVTPQSHGERTSPGGSITHLDLRTRRALVEAVVQPRPGKLEWMRHEVIEDVHEPKVRQDKLMGLFDKALQNLEEGLMVKDLTSPYVVGEKSRSRQHWVKMKADYSDQTTNLDVLVLGAYWASGRARGGRFSSFLLGVQADKREREGEEDFMTHSTVDGEEGQRSVLDGRRFYTLGRTGSGFTTKDLEELHRYVDQRSGWKPWQAGKLPKHMKPWRASKGDIPDCWAEPQDSIILEVKCAEIPFSDQFSSGYTLRFSRVEAIRYDKPWHECMTLSELKAIVDDPAARPTALSQKKRGRHASSESSDEARPTQRSGPSVQRVRLVESFKVPTAADVTRMTDMLDEMEFCVIGDCEMGPDDEHGSESESCASSSEESSEGEEAAGPRKGTPCQKPEGPKGKAGRMKQEDVQRMIVQHGGKVVMTPRVGSTDAVIAPHGKLLRVAHLIHGGRFDIVSCKWLVGCAKKGVWSPPGYHDFIYMTEKTRQRWAKQVDAFGDAYNDRVTRRELSRCMSRMPKSGKSKGWRDTAARHLEHEEFTSILTGGPILFFKRNVVIYADIYEQLGPVEPKDAPSGAVSLEFPAAAAVSPAGASKAVSSEPRVPVPFTSLDAACRTIAFRGGVLASSLNWKVTHLLVDPKRPERFPALSKRLRILRRHPKSRFERRVVNTQWVYYCVGQGRIVPPLSEHMVSI